MSSRTTVRSDAPAPDRTDATYALRKRPPLYRRRTRAAWGFALPFALLFTVFTAGPVIMSLLMAVTDIRSRDLRDPLAVEFVGLDNFVAVLQDATFRKAALNTAYFVLVGVPLTLALALAVAVVLNAGVTRLTTFFRVGYYMPAVTSIVAVAVVWRFLLHPDQGMLNEVLGWFGVEGPNWLASTTWAMPSMIAMATWRSIGTLIVIFLAGLQGVPASLHEAAALDGAGAWQRFRYITVPTLRPTLLFGAVITGIGYVQFFEEPFVMTQGGPLNSTLSVAFETYNQFGFGNYGYAAAMSYVLFVAVVLLALVQFWLLGEREAPRRRRRVVVANKEVGR
ncbi:sugar ABC transporter permease [Georgenia sp. 311]|uniref:Sugar ABC transporter permease n=1 Tax=Georgenia wutianyii TaxID=2585135 RepID=A0ABX5VM43_9MICO|nr:MULTISPECIES: sugar ABC transporter permease [Georgenia]QDB79547.1 sugar ABC transporter permease [Georgenia wutianyii]TNC20541.1 sugar ABC transporter permease [Georgenia sp. 311]